MTEPLERIVYCSTATVKTDSLLAIADILAVSRRNNERDGLTGALLGLLSLMDAQADVDRDHRFTTLAGA